MYIHRKIEKQLMEIGGGTLGVDHDNKMVLWYDLTENEYNINRFTVNADGLIDVEPMPSFNFSAI